MRGVQVRSAEFVLSWPKWRKDELEPLPIICFAGRSNVGKSSLLNCLASRKSLARTSNTPGRTQALNVFRIGLKRGERERAVHFVDLPGYGFAKVPPEVRAQWRPMIDGFLRGNPLLRAAMVLLDSRRTPGEEDFDVLDLLEENEVPSLVVITKVDKFGKTQRGKPMREIALALELEKSDLWPFSSVTGEGRVELLEAVWEAAGIGLDTGEEITPDMPLE